MALNVWTQPSGYSFGVYEERKLLDITLPVINDSGTTYSKISGSIPDGLRIQGNHLVGIPFEVSRLTEYTFCIRASNAQGIADRTFKMSIDGADTPTFITNSGLLPIGPAQQFYILDSSYVEYQIEAIDQDTSLGQKLSYFIAANDGALPPGLVLTQDGRITGFIQPALAIRPEDGSGTYDDTYYDAVAYDFAVLPSNGYDSYIYDSVFYGFNIATNLPKKLNRTYEFTVTVTDGDSVVKRTFRMFVVSDEYFRADNTDNSTLLTADITFLRPPVWITPSELGIYRANNYLTFILDTFDRENIQYLFEQVNSDVIAKTLKISPTDNIAGSVSITITNASGIPEYGQYLTFQDRIFANNVDTSKIYQISAVQSLGSDRYRLTVTNALVTNIADDIEFFIGSLSVIPPGMTFDVATAEVYGVVPYQPAVTTTYQFTVTAIRLSDTTETARIPRKFTINVIGEIDTTIIWNTDSNLGAIDANYVSTLNVKATSTVPGAIVLYKITDGQLPAGLNLNLDGEIIGKPNQFGEPGNLGLTRFYDEPPAVSSKTFTTFDNRETTIDRVYKFTVTAQDQYRYSEISREFTITINTPNQLLFSNLKVKPFLKLDQRSNWKSFINDSTIFNSSSVYRLDDPNFGVQTDLEMIVYAGIETKEAAAYVSAIGLNHKKKRFVFGNVKKASAVIPGTKTVVYEVVYVEMIDPLEPNGKRLGNKLTNLGLQSKTITIDSSNSIWSTSLNSLATAAPTNKRPEPIITVDSEGYFVSNSNPGTYFPNSISNWRDRLEAVGETERNYLPLWMRSIQPGGNQELGFQLAVPLCYCKVGQGDSILNNINNALKTKAFDFKLLDYTADRYIIDAVEGQASDKYLVFKNDRITV